MNYDQTFFLLINEARQLLKASALGGEQATQEDFDLFHENVKLITYAGFLRHLLRRSQNNVQHDGEKAVKLTPTHLPKAS